MDTTFDSLAPPSRAPDPSDLAVSKARLQAAGSAGNYAIAATTLQIAGQSLHRFGSVCPGASTARTLAP
jgi:hypothetical protein